MFKWLCREASFKVFIVLGMYNFGRAMKFRLLLVRMMSEWLMSIGQYFGMKFIKKGNLRRAIQKHEWMPRMLPTHSTLPPSAIEKVILSLSYEEMTRKIYVDAKLSRWLNLENFMFNIKTFFFIIKKKSRNVSFCIAIQPILVGGKKIKILALAEDQKNYHTYFFTCSH